MSRKRDERWAERNGIELTYLSDGKVAAFSMQSLDRLPWCWSRHGWAADGCTEPANKQGRPMRKNTRLTYENRHVADGGYSVQMVPDFHGTAAPAMLAAGHHMRPVELPDKSYSPGMLHERFAQLGRHATASPETRPSDWARFVVEAERFAGKYGLLTTPGDGYEFAFPPERRTYASDKRQAEWLSFWVEHSYTMLRCVEAWWLVIDGDDHAIAFHEPQAEALRQLWSAKLRKEAPERPDFPPYEGPVTTREGLKAVVAEHVSLRLASEEVFTATVPVLEDEDEDVRIEQIVYNLLGLLWSEMLLWITTGTKIPCAVCGQMLMAAAPQLGTRRRDTRYCGPRCRAAAHRKKRGQARALAGKGWDVARIAAELDAPESAVRRWIRPAARSD